MPRTKRITRQNHCHHILFRGINGEKVFLDDRDRIKFCHLLQEAAEKNNLHIHGFCLMSNHIHLIIEPTKIDSSLQSGIHSFAFRYAQFFNKRHKRKGYLFQGRYKSILVQDGTYLRRLIRYVHLNPVDAEISLRPEDYKWSSYRAYLEIDQYAWLQTDLILSRFSETRESAIDKFVEFTHHKIDAKSDLEIIPKIFRKGIFGEEKFNNECGVINIKEKIAYPSYRSLNELIENICRYFNVKINDLSSSIKNKSIVKARGVIALIVRRSNQWSLEELGRILNKNSGTLSRLASNAELQTDLLAYIDELS